MREISTPEVAVLAGELGPLQGMYVENFYETREGEFRIRLGKRGEKADLSVLLARAVFKTRYIQKQVQPTNFAIAVRRRIENFVLERIAQLDSDRILVFDLRKGSEALRMILEMFGKGNVIVTDPEMKILLAYHVHEFADRTIRPGEIYKQPKQVSRKFEIPEKIAPVLYKGTDGAAVDYSLTENPKYKDTTAERFATLQELYEAAYGNIAPQVEQSPEARAKIEELKKSIAKQEKILLGIDEQIDENKAAGAEVLSRMEFLNRIIKAAQSDKRITKEQLQKMFPEVKIINVDLKDKTLTIEL